MKTREKCISLYKISCGSAVSSPEKLRFPALLLLSPCIIFVKDKLHSGNEGLAFRVLMSNMTARDIPYSDDDNRLSGICSCCVCAC